MILKKHLTLSNGVKIPALGFGTWLIPNNKAAEAVRQAIKVGYRHIDTAEAYGNEEGVGEGIRTSGVPREKIFLQTKLHAEAKTYGKAKKEIKLSFKKLGVDYIDLMIIHSPQPWDSFRDGNHYYKGNLAAWKALCKFYKAGKIKAIGVSNFEKEDIENLIQNSNVKPMVNQILTHIGNTPFNLIKYCKDNGIIVEAYSPIAHGELLKNTIIQKMAKKYKVSVAQLCVRYTLQLGLVSLPKSINPVHIKENADVNFEISKEDMKKLMDIEQIKDYGEHSYFPVFSGKLKESKWRN